MLACFAFATGACERDDAVAISESAAARQAGAAPPVASHRQADAARPDLAPAVLPARGTFSIDVSDDGVSVAANEASLTALLEALGAKLEFKVNIAASLTPRKATISVTGETVERVLARLLQNIPYALRFEPDETDEHTTLAALEVGRLKTRTKLERVTERSERKREGRTQISPAEREAARLASQQTLREKLERQPEYRADLESRDPAQRTRGLAGLDIEDPENFERAADMLRNDPDPGVREAAAETLSDSDSPASLDVLMAALEDPDPEVVRTTLDLIALYGDATLVPRLRELGANHPDPTLRPDFIIKAEFLDN